MNCPLCDASLGLTDTLTIDPHIVVHSKCAHTALLIAVTDALLARHHATGGAKSPSVYGPIGTRLMMNRAAHPR